MRARVEILYNGQDASSDIEGLLMSFVYSDKTEGESDSIDITLDNKDLRWLNKWRPLKGDTIDAKILDGTGHVLPCGVFTVDTFNASGSGSGGDIVTIKALAASIKHPLRSARTIAHENKTLREIAVKVADRNGLTVQGITKDFRIKYIAQYKETDLAFLHRLSMMYGYVFSVRDKKLVFTRIYDLNGLAAAAVVDRLNTGSYTINDKITQVYNRARFRKRHQGKNEVLTSEVSADNSSADVLEVQEPADDAGQAEEIAKSKLHRANLEQITMDISGVPGNIYLLGGSNVQHTGWGEYDGIYTIGESTHTVNGDGGYITGYNSKFVRKA